MGDGVQVCLMYDISEKLKADDQHLVVTKLERD
jgi:hypothetical protein